MPMSCSFTHSSTSSKDVTAETPALRDKSINFTGDGAGKLRALALGLLGLVSLPSCGISRLAQSERRYGSNDQASAVLVNSQHSVGSSVGQAPPIFGSLPKFQPVPAAPARPLTLGRFLFDMPETERCDLTFELNALGDSLTKNWSQISRMCEDPVGLIGNLLVDKGESMLKKRCAESCDPSRAELVPHVSFRDIGAKGCRFRPIVGGAFGELQGGLDISYGTSLGTFIGRFQKTESQDCEFQLAFAVDIHPRKR